MGYYIEVHQLRQFQEFKFDEWSEVLHVELSQDPKWLITIVILRYRGE